MTLQPPERPLERSLLDDEGSATWVCELLDPHGNGVILSWGFGHPEARAGERGPARAFPSIALRVFARGQMALSLHARFDEDDAGWHAPAGRWTFGASQLEALRDLRSQVVIARLHLPLPGTQHALEGHVEMGGMPRRQSDPHDDDTGIDWSPMTAFGEGRAILRAGDRHFHLSGRAAHVRFGSTAPRAFAWLHAGLGEEDRWAMAAADVGLRGLTVDGEGGSAIVDLTREGDTFREGEVPFLRLEKARELMRRPLGHEVLANARGPMALPTPALLHTVGAGEARRASDFVYSATGRNPRGARVENGLVEGKAWRRFSR